MHREGRSCGQGESGEKSNDGGGITGHHEEAHTEMEHMCKLSWKLR